MRHQLPPKFSVNDTLVLEDPIVIEFNKPDGGSFLWESRKTMILWMGLGNVIQVKKSWFTGKYHYLVGSKIYGELSTKWYREDQLGLADSADIAQFKAYFRDHYEISDFMSGWPVRLDWLGS